MSGNTNIVVSCLHGYCVITLILCEKIRKEGKKERRKEGKKESEGKKGRRKMRGKGESNDTVYVLIKLII